MSENAFSFLKCKVRKNSSPDGKCKVYFCCCREDFERYFEEISNDILTDCDCAIYYYPSNVVIPAEIRQSDLAQMNLFVMPVTVGLVYGTFNNQAKNDAYFAILNNIPLLPIMTEDSLIGKFTDAFPGQTWINKYSDDSAKLSSYKDDFNAYLRDAIVSGEALSKIKKSFDAYIFLSYCKEDRQFVDPLMQKIHQVNGYQNVAIWHDQFLTSNNILMVDSLTALKKSSIFLMLVTPNMASSDRLDEEREYVEARIENKTVMAIEMDKTDLDQLKRHYPEIPNPANIDDEDEFNRILCSANKEFAVGASNARRDYYLGLAYLYGIDVEINHKRALELIEKAANAGIQEAIERLVIMYRIGLGVDSNYTKLIRWDCRLIANKKDKFAKDPSHENYSSIFNSLIVYCQDISDHESLQEVLASYDVIIEFLTLNSSKFDTRPELSLCYRLKGTIASKGGLPSDAITFFQQAAEIDRTLVNETRVEKTRLQLADDYFLLGFIHESQNMFSNAQHYYQEALHVSQKTENESGTAETRRHIAMVLKRLENIAGIEKRWADAESYCQSEIDIYRDLVKETGMIGIYRELANSLTRLENIAGVNGRYADAKFYCEQASEVWKTIVNKTGAIQDRLELVQRLDRQGHLCFAGFRNCVVIASPDYYFSQKIDILKELANETGTVESYRNLASALVDFAGFCYPETTESYYRQAIEPLKIVAMETRSEDDWKNVAKNLDRLGQIADNNDQPSKAEDYYLQEMEVRKMLADDTKSSQDFQDLAKSLGALGGIAEGDGRLSDAENFYLKSFKAFRSITDPNKLREAKQGMAACLERLETVASMDGRADDARLYRQRCHEIVSGLK